MLNIIDLKSNKIDRIKKFKYYIYNIEYNYEPDLVIIYYVKRSIFGSSYEILITKIVEL